MDKSERVKRHYMICARIGRGLFASPEPVEALPLGGAYVVRVSKLNVKRSALFEKIKAKLSELEPEELEANFLQDGTPRTDNAVKLVARFRSEVDQEFGRLPIWFSVPFFHTEGLADFEYWGRSEFLSVDEVVWLSLGFEPKEEFKAAIKPFDARGARQKPDSIAQYISRHKEILRRKFDPNDYGLKPDLFVLKSWIENVQLEVQPKFLMMLQRSSLDDGAPTTRGDQPAQASAIIPVKTDGREITSLAKLLTAIAISEFGYDPKQRRSPIPNEIQSLADQLGLSMSSDTIRKYLQIGAKHLADDWRPDK